MLTLPQAITLYELVHYEDFSHAHELNDPIQELALAYRQRYQHLYRDGVGYDCGPGWWPYLNALGAQLEQLLETELVGHTIKIVQVKEKFGDLVVYYRVHKAGFEDSPYGTGPEVDRALADRVSSIVNTTLAATHGICEVCGAPGAYDDSGWTKTLCEHHRAMRTRSETRRQARYMAKQAVKTSATGDTRSNHDNH